MTWKRKLQELMILQHLSIGDLLHILTFLYDFTIFFNVIFFNCFCSLFKSKHPILVLQLENYTAELDIMKNMTRQEYVAHLRR